MKQIKIREVFSGKYPILLGSVICVILLAGFMYALLLKPTALPADQQYIYIKESESGPLSHPTEVSMVGKASGLGWRMKVYSLFFDYHLRPGRYEVVSNPVKMFRHLRNGLQAPMDLTIPSVRTLEQLAAYLGDHTMTDQSQWLEKFVDSSFCAQWGYNDTTLMELVIPNTYQVYWSISPREFMERMSRENEKFWNDAREKLANGMGFSHLEVATLASIVDEETSNDAEKPMIAGMYINRLKMEMPLQADPTIKFALKDFMLKRIYHQHLLVDSPWNTYKHVGLPPGPIRIASIAGIDAVLHYVKHPYVYMCAKEDFSGTHNFATTYSEHLANARRYQKALNERNIK